MYEKTDPTIDKLLVMPHLAKAKILKDCESFALNLNDKDKEIYQALIPLREVLDNYFDYYQFDEDVFRFRFPPSQFSQAEMTVINTGSHGQLNQNTFKDSFEKSQLISVWKKGTFEVPSRISSIPYVWRVSPWIVKGLSNNIESWQKEMAASYHQLRQVEKRFIGDTLSLKLNLMEFAVYPKRIANMLVGVKQMREACRPDFDRIVEIRFMLHKFKKYYHQTPQQLTEALKLPVFVDRSYSIIRRQQEEEAVRASQQLYQSLCRIDSSFEIDWKPFERQRIRQYRVESANPESKELEQILTRQKMQRYDMWLKQKVPMEYQDQIFGLLRVFVIIRKLMAEKDKKLNEALTKIQNQVRERHKIRHRSPYFWDEQVQARYEVIKDDMEKTFWKSLKAQIHQKMFDQYIEFREDFDRQVKQLQPKLPTLYEPRRTFYTSYRLFPPYVIQNANGYYSLKKYENMQIDTGHHFWKISLYKMRLISWTRNCFFWLVANAWAGPFGLKVLFSLKAFNTQQMINSRTGEIYFQTQQCLLEQFVKVIDGIKASRNHFQSQPDTGLFGKKFSRIFNLIECYIFRLVIVGIFLLLFCYPIAIILNSTISFFLALTSWLWTPLCMLVCYIFNIIVYQFEIDDGYRANRYSERWFPLISTPLMFILNNVRIIIYLLGALIIHPILSLIISVYAILHFIWSFVTDYFMYIVVKMLARTPSRDTKIAWKVSGPGMSRQFYDSIQEEDVYILVEAQLEKIYLSKYRQQAEQKINQPLNIYERVMGWTLSALNGYKSNSYNVIQQRTTTLRNCLNKQLERYHKRYPQHKGLSRVRFTAEELEHYMDNTVRLVRKFVETKDCLWIFRKQNLDMGDYDELAKNILRNIFSYEIVEPLEDLEMRFELKQQGQSQSKQAIIRALQGEVELNLRKPSMKRQLKTLNVGQIRIVCISDVISDLKQNMGEYVQGTRYYPNLGMIIHPWIRQIIKNDIKIKRYDRYYEEQPAVI